MNLNKKASGLTNPMSFIIILAVIGLLSAVLVSMGVSMSSQDNTNFDYNSAEWLSQETGFKIENKTMDSGILTNKQIKEQWYVSNETEGGNEKDFALEFFFGLSWIDKVFSFLYDIYNIPSFFIRWSPLPQEDFEILINAINVVVWFAIAGMVLYVVRGIKT